MEPAAKRNSDHKFEVRKVCFELFLLIYALVFDLESPLIYYRENRVSVSIY